MRALKMLVGLKMRMLAGEARMRCALWYGEYSHAGRVIARQSESGTYYRAGRNGEESRGAPARQRRRIRIVSRRACLTTTPARCVIVVGEKYRMAVEANAIRRRALFGTLQQHRAIG